MNNVMLVLIIAVGLVGCFKKVDESKVVAKVGSKIFIADDVNKRISDLDPQLQAYFKEKENKVRLLDQLIEEELIYRLAKKTGLHRSKDFKNSLDQMHRQALITFYIQQSVDNITEVSPDEIKEFYQKNSDQYSEYEIRNLSHILVKTKEEANKVQDLIQKGQKFDVVAKKYSIDTSKDQGGQLGWVRKEKLVSEFANAAFRLSKKSPISGVVKTEFGYHIIQLNDTKSMPMQTLDSVYDNISNQLLSVKKRDKFNSILDVAKSELTIERKIENL
jgi:peptidyl-prolyl cis-trans isomerase C